MTTSVKDTAQLNTLRLQQTMGAPLDFNTVSLKFEIQNDAVIDCRLQLEIDAEQYTQIDEGKHFNLTSEIKGPHIGNPFHSDPPIHLEILLKPDLLPALLAQAQTAEAAANYLTELSRQQTMTQTTESSATVNPLLQTESWLCLSVKQQQESGEVGFTTFWHSINPALLNNPDTTSDQLADGIVNFVKEWTDVNLAKATQTVTSQFLKGITETFGEFLDGALENLTDEDDASDSLFATVLDFFQQEDWPFAKIAETISLRLSFRGDNGQWNCYAKVNEDQRTFLFYSICPIPAPEERLAAISEFITRANYGLIIGNFELDYTDGEIRYKTSIDTEGDTLTPALIKPLVYTNVLSMDQYLPGILAVIEQNTEPKAAIQMVEASGE